MIMKLVDKGVALDEAPLRVLLETDKPTHGALHHPSWVPPPPPSGRQQLKVAGTLLLFAAAGLGVFFAIAGKAGSIAFGDAMAGLAVAGGIATFALGLFVAVVFTDPPPRKTKAISPTE
jgi:hypothetical protein